jgi:hypothetical protein
MRNARPSRGKGGNMATKQQGINTREIGETLKRKIDKNPGKLSGAKLFYDHGDPANVEVCQPTSYMGKRYGADATLSAIDIVITKGNKVILAVEIEEGKVRPKTVIGDIFGIVLCDRVHILRKPYLIDNTTIIVAIAQDNNKGKQAEKYVRLERKLGKYLKSNPPTGIRKIRIISCPTKDIVNRIERLIRLEAGKSTKQ